MGNQIQQILKAESNRLRLIDDVARTYPVYTVTGDVRHLIPYSSGFPKLQDILDGMHSGFAEWSSNSKNVMLYVTSKARCGCVSRLPPSIFIFSGLHGKEAKTHSRFQGKSTGKPHLIG